MESKNLNQDEDFVIVPILCEQASDVVHKNRFSLGRSETPPSISFTIPVNDASQSRLKNRRCPKDVLTQDDYFALSKWYAKIDEHFSALLKNMDAFYANIYQEEFNIMKQQMEHFSNCLEVGQASVFHESETKKLQKGFLKLHENKIVFSDLKKAIESTQYAQLLRAYLDTKFFIYEQEVERCKINYWIFYRNEINKVFTDKIELLKDNIYVEAIDMITD